MTQCLQKSKQMEKVMKIETDIDWYEKEDETKQREWTEAIKLSMQGLIRTGQENLNAETDKARSFNRDCKGELELAQLKTGNLTKIKKIRYYGHVVALRPPAGKQLNCQKATHQATISNHHALKKTL